MEVTIMKKEKYEDKHLIFAQPQVVNLKYLAKKIILPIFAMFYKFWMMFHRKHMKKEKKYKVVLCAIFKNEAKYLKEWLDFHIIVGVEHFYLYNNNSSDNFAEILKPFIEDGTVELIEWTKKHAQMEAYRDCIEKFSEFAQWIGFIDIDEFVVPNKDRTIYDFLKAFDKNRPSVMIYWKIFGSSGYLVRDCKNLVIEDFTVCWPKFVNIGKCFYNTNFTFDFKTVRNYSFHHCLWTRLGIVSVPPVNIFDKISFNIRHKVKDEPFPIQINHYFTKSYSEYVEKSARGDAYYKINPYDRNYFYKYEKNCADTDYNIFKYLIEVKSGDIYESAND